MADREGYVWRFLGLFLLAGGLAQIEPRWAALLIALGIVAYVNGKTWGA